MNVMVQLSIPTPYTNSERHNAQRYTYSTDGPSDR